MRKGLKRYVGMTLDEALEAAAKAHRAVNVHYDSIPKTKLGAKQIAILVRDNRVTAIR